MNNYYYLSPWWISCLFLPSNDTIAEPLASGDNMIWNVAITTWSEMWQSQHDLNCGNHNMIWTVAITTSGDNMIWNVAITTWSKMWQSQHDLNSGNHNMIWNVAITTWSEIWQSQHDLKYGNHNIIWNVAITTWSELWQLHHEFYFSIITLYHVSNSVNLLTFILRRLANLGVTCGHACNRLPLKSHEQVLQ